MRYFRNNSKLISRLLINQVGMTIFGMIMTMAVMRSTSNNTAITVVVSIFSILFYLCLIYNVMWEEGARNGIRVNAVAPGLIYTKIMSRYSESDVKGFNHKIPVGRGGTVEEIVPTIQFLADVEKTRFIVGQVIFVDGGQSCDGSIESMNFPMTFAD